VFKEYNLFTALSGLEPAHKPRLLLVDDQPINIQVMHRVFAEDCQVFMATSGAQALQQCRDNPPDLILLDVVMPEMDGYEVCRRLKADEATRHIPVIFVTAENDPEQETRGLSIGAVDFITKPINPSVLRARAKTHLLLKYQSDMLRKLVFFDGLTGVYNRRHFDQQLAQEWARSTRSGSPLSLVILDVDFFKRYNDRYGHQAGDDCLRHVSKVLQKSLKRASDVVARYGGEEFACLLPDTDFDHAMQIAGQLEQGVRAAQLLHEDSDVAKVVTISLGVATRSGTDRTDKASELLTLADAELYRAKAHGRGRVHGAPLPGPA
jgi:diguanylate cyclase (GGDEF)-like protein